MNLFGDFNPFCGGGPCLSFIVAQGLHFSGHVDGAWQKFGFGKIDYSTTSALCYLGCSRSKKKTCFSAHLGATFVPKDNTISTL